MNRMNRHKNSRMKSPIVIDHRIQRDEQILYTTTNQNHSISIYSMWKFRFVYYWRCEQENQNRTNNREQNNQIEFFFSQCTLSLNAFNMLINEVYRRWIVNLWKKCRYSVLQNRYFESNVTSTDMLSSSYVCHCR